MQNQVDSRCHHTNLADAVVRAVDNAALWGEYLDAPLEDSYVVVVTAVDGRNPMVLCGFWR
jgi:hypothetical protein